MKYFKALSMPAWNYLEAEKTDDVRYLLILKNYYELPAVKEKDLSILKEAFENVNMQVSQFELEHHNLSKDIFEKTRQLKRIETDYLFVFNMVQYLMMAGPDKEIESELNKLGHKIRDGKDFIQELKRILNQNENTQIKINDKREELDLLIPKSKGQKVNIDRLLLNIKRHEKRQIDLKEITLTEWLLMKVDLIKESERIELENAKRQS